MKRFLYIILVAVAAVLLWAINAEAYANGLVFSLGILVSALSGYLIADYFLRTDKNTLSNNLHISQKENQALKERVDLLQTQLNTATPHAEVVQFQERVQTLEEEKSKLDGFSRAQTAEIASLREKIEGLAKANDKLVEDSTITTETTNAQILALREELNSVKAEKKALTDENEALTQQNASLTSELDNLKNKQSQTDENTEGGERGIFEDEEISGRGLVITELEEDEVSSAEDEAAYGTSDNLQAIEGIGSKFEDILKSEGIFTWEALSMASPERIKTILDNSGTTYHSIYPVSWTEQARLLVHREFGKLKKYKEYIAGNE
ncbi:MAG: hypothetical protein JNL70_05720 [Saprospiraceae bacterium]|nr:hypothetical protein [Saprospiraceae bacterium]